MEDGVESDSFTLPVSPGSLYFLLMATPSIYQIQNIGPCPFTLLSLWVPLLPSLLPPFASSKEFRDDLGITKIFLFRFSVIHFDTLFSIAKFINIISMFERLHFFYYSEYNITSMCGAVTSISFHRR